MGNEHDRSNKLVLFVNKYLVCNFQPLTQHVSIVRNNIKTKIHLQTLRNLNRIKQDMLLVPKTIHAQHYYALNGKMKVKKITDKSLMSDLLWVKR